MFSKACEYGIRAAIFIAGQSTGSRRVGLREVAEEIDSPAAYTSKILQKLSKADIIVSDKGPTGGFSIDSGKIHTLKLADVVEAIDGNEIFTKCGMGLKQCNAKMPCPLHHKFKAVRDSLQAVIEGTTIIELSDKIEDGLGFLRR